MVELLRIAGGPDIGGASCRLMKALVTCLVCCSVGVGAELKRQMLVEPPFDKHDHKGSRIIPYFEKTGATNVMGSYVRVRESEREKGVVCLSEHRRESRPCIFSMIYIHVGRIHISLPPGLFRALSGCSCQTGKMLFCRYPSKTYWIVRASSACGSCTRQACGFPDNVLGLTDAL